MVRFIDHISRSISQITGIVYGIARRFDYEEFSRYILDVNQMKDLEGIAHRTAVCLSDILECKLFGFAVQFGENMEAWVGPGSHGTAIRNIIEKDFKLQANSQVHHLKDDAMPGVDRQVVFTTASIDSYIITGDSYLAGLYILPGRKQLGHHRHIIAMLLRTLSIAISNIMKIKRLESQAAFDQLTDCYNRHEFNRLIEHSISSAQRHERELSLILLDLDHFKSFNDTYGHQAGDKVLKEVSRRIKSSIRGGDYVTRYGGEEFVVVLPDTTLDNAVDLAERLRVVIKNQPIDVSEEVSVRATASFGVASLKDFPEKTRLIEEADKMLYRAKSAGRDKVLPNRKPHIVRREPDNKFGARA